MTVLKMLDLGDLIRSARAGKRGWPGMCSRWRRQIGDQGGWKEEADVGFGGDIIILFTYYY